jgi:hypothetical protein
MTEVTLAPFAPARSLVTARRLLACGTVAGPLYLGVVSVQVVTRDGFDLRDHPLSLLSTGDRGWIQIANFVVCGLLYLAAAVGMRRTLRGSRGGTWGPALFGVFGFALVWAGVFVADPAEGFPVGTPDGAGEMSLHGVLHTMAPAVAFPALAIACLVFARRFAGQRRRGWMVYSVGTAIALFVPDLFIANRYFYVVLALAAVAGWAWASAVCARIARASERH